MALLVIAMIGESIDILLLFNNLEELNPDINPGDDVSFAASRLRKAFEKDRDIHSSNNSHLATLLQQEAYKSEFTSQFQFDVISLQKSEAVLDILESKQFDVLIWDDFLPEAENLEIISQINSQAPHLAMIITGEWDDEQTVIQILQLGAQDYLNQSELTPKQFLRRMLRAIGRQQKLDLQAKLDRTPKSILSDTYKTEKVLPRSEGKLRAIFERSSIGIGLIDMSTRIVDTNPALCLMLGYSQDQMYGKRFTDYISPDELKSDLELYQQLIAGICDRFEMERRFVRRDGRIVWTYLSVSLLPSTDGESKLFLAIIEDITERKHTEFKLRQSKEAAEAGSRAKSEFLATMSHELRTPLNAIMGLSQLLVQNIVGDLNDKQKEYVNCIYTSGEHLLALINDILDLSKVEAGREELLLSPLVIKDLCQVVISTVSDRAREKDLELTAQIDRQAKICIADERRLKQMLLNLLTNAIKFTPKGKVSLIVKKVNKGISFTVNDTGIGIDSSQFQSLFEPFQQLDSRLNRQYEGTGLGLALTRKLAQLHGGDISLKSELGQGSSFTLFLPDRESEDEWEMELQTDSENDDTASISNPSLLNTRTKRIAIVEDEVNTANLLQDYLQTFGYRVEIFANTEDFLTQIRNYLPDLMLLSAQLDGNRNGWDLLVQLRQQKNLQDLPVIMMTPMGMAKEYPKNLQNDKSKMKILEEAGAIDYLSKPIRTLQLESILMHYRNHV